ncbi:hypothetical protein CFELI_13865 [Corynebacterium felinum]|uniref:DUF3558 domain-containing protein n=5 Tax=Corynebacterium felinum TaxID=131318 RepID=A0ABU2B6D2_9CORY|nr:DUF3558 family protein [Corynebacterium felinum]MDR7354173.1 hypothetical protein [Corynebacterium felinum]WJY96344.1 hypothetical protein CFELI_13865 [Corynebacterium felinum]
MKSRTALLPLVISSALVVVGCSHSSTTQAASTTVASSLVPTPNPTVVPDIWYRPAMIPLPPDREYTEGFDPSNRTQKLYNPCDELTAEELAELELEKIGRTRTESTLFDCGMEVLGQDGGYNVTTHLATYAHIKERGLIIDATFPDVDDRVYFSHIRHDTADHCDAAVSTENGRLSITYKYREKEPLPKDELCRRAYEVMQKLRVKGGYR